MANTTLPTLISLLTDNLTGNITGADLQTITTALWNNAIITGASNGNIPVFGTDVYLNTGTITDSGFNAATMPLSNASINALSTKVTTPAGGGNGDVLTKNGSLASWTTLTKTHVGLPNVDNTSDSSKPVSISQQAALDLKQDLVYITSNTALNVKTYTLGEATDTDIIIETDANIDITYNNTIKFDNSAEFEAPIFIDDVAAGTAALKEGKLFYNSTTKQLKYSDGTSWISSAAATAASTSYSNVLSGTIAVNVQDAIDEVILGGITIGEAGFIFKEDTGGTPIGKVYADATYFYVSTDTGEGGLRLRKGTMGTYEASIRVAGTTSGSASVIEYNQNLTTPTGYIRGTTQAAATPTNVMTWDNTGVTFPTNVTFSTQPSGLTMPIPYGYLSGLTMSNSLTFPNTDIEIGVGSCVDSTGSSFMTINPIYTIEFDKVIGVDNGGRPSAITLTASTWYHVLVCAKTDGSNPVGVFDTSITATNALADLAVIDPLYTIFRRIGSVYIDGSSNIKQFWQNGDEFRWKNPIQSHSGAITNAAGGTTVTTLCPTGVSSNAKLIVEKIFDNQGTTFLTYCPYLDEPTVGAVNSGNMYHVGGIIGDDIGGTAEISVFTNTTSQVKCKANITGVTGIVITLGWCESRGKN
jgi:hypothetical protein